MKKNEPPFQESRKKFLKQLAAGSLGLGLSSCILDTDPAGKVATSGKSMDTQYKWRMVTTWPPDFPILGEAANEYARLVNVMSGGRIEIRVFGGGELVPALQAFDAVQQNTAQLGCGAPYYWAGKSKAAQLFSAVPFGMNQHQVSAWLFGGDGYELWKEVYADFGLVPIPGGNTGMQMGGWFNKELNTAADIHGLKMRIPGLGGSVLEQAGGAAVLVAGGEIYTSLERGVIDATEWVGPFHDYRMGFHRIAKYYYYPGWHEPGSQLEFFINRSTFESLPADLQEICLSAGLQLQAKVAFQFDAKNAEYLQKIKQEGTVDLRPYPRDVLQVLRQKSEEVMDDLTASDPMAAKVYESYRNFRNRLSIWTDVGDRAYFEQIDPGGQK